MSEKHLEKYNDVDFLKMLFREFKNKGISEINRPNLEKDLYYYKKNPKYMPLFQNIGTRGKMIPLLDAFNVLEKRKEIVALSYALDDYAITDNVYGPLGEFDQVETLLLIKELVKEYLLRKRVIETAHGNIRICGINPNDSYVLIEGYHGDKYITWNLVTDGKITEKAKKEIGHYPLIWSNPEEVKDGITIRNGSYEEVQVENASFTILNGKVNDEVKGSLLYSESLNEQELKKQANYASLSKIPKKSYVKELSLGK